MIELSKSKGITPVIAIVLLLLITVGAVGVVFTQFNSLVSGNDAQQQANQLQKAQAASYSITAVNNTGGYYGVVLKNTGDVIYNLSAQSTLMMGVNGGSPVAVTARGGNDCGDDFGALQPGDDAFCNTSISWDPSYENDGQSTTVQLMINENTKATYTCTETTDSFC